MALAPFCSAALRGNKKDLRPARTHSNGSLGQKSENFCGATQLGDLSPSRRRAVTRLSLVTGEKSVGPYWESSPFSPPSAVHSPGPPLLPSHRRQLSWRGDVRLLVRVIGLCCELGLSVQQAPPSCQVLKKTLAHYHKRERQNSWKNPRICQSAAERRAVDRRPAKV